MSLREAEATFGTRRRPEAQSLDVNGASGLHVEKGCQGASAHDASADHGASTVSRRLGFSGRPSTYYRKGWSAPPPILQTSKARINAIPDRERKVLALFDPY
jgi:hypothetical protein